MACRVQASLVAAFSFDTALPVTGEKGIKILKSKRGFHATCHISVLQLSIRDV